MSHITISLIINYLALATTVWLGWYVVTRSPRNLLSWLTGLTLWSVGGLFLNTILALDPLPPPTDSPEWLQVVFPFWSIDTFERGWSGWLHGWQVVPAIVFWHHATMIMRPGEMNGWRWARVIFGYGLALAVIGVLYIDPTLFVDVSTDLLYLNTIKPGPVYLPFLLLLGLFTFLCLINIFRSMRASTAELSRQQFVIMAIATIIAGLTAPITYIAAEFEIRIPKIIYTVLLLISVVLIGYGVARYSALMEGRTIRRDFFTNAIMTGLVTVVYSLVTWISVKFFGVPAAAFVFVIILAIITHNLVDVTRHTLDWLFFQRESQEIRANLRILASHIREQDLGENISLALNSICGSVRATFGAVILFDDQSTVDLLAAYRFVGNEISQSAEGFLTDDILTLELDQLQPPFDEAVLLIPLYADSNQFGAVILGRPSNGMNYSKEDIELLLYPSDRLAEILSTAQREKEYLNQLTQLKEKSQPIEQIPTKEVEIVLRNIYDYALLGDSLIANLKLVDAKLSMGEVTHIDRGKAVNNIVTEAVEKLRPDTEVPKDPPPREWYPYLILHGAYMENKLNRDIMSRLYISEGTFNRTRRAAIRSIARVLEEMETMHH